MPSMDADTRDVVLQSLATWDEFLDSYGIDSEGRRKVFSECPELVMTNIYTAGMSIAFFKSWGFRDRDIRHRIIAYYPSLLAKTREHHFEPVLTHLQQAGCRGEHLRLLIWEYPRIFSRDYVRQTNKFAKLGVYGLTLAGLRA